jgi:signal recognition particle receptor subunit beta
MSFINHNAKVIHLKVVYYGPSLSGKTTNVRYIYQQTGVEDAQLKELNTDVERTFFFDFLPLGIGDIRGYQTRFHIFTVPGQVVYDASRRFIMKGLDGVIFVADSQRERMEENLQSLKNLEKNLEQQGYDIREIPLVMQYNKRDLPNVSSLSEMRNLLNPFNAPEIEACASRGTGVLESLKTVSKSIVHVLKGGALI